MGSRSPALARSDRERVHALWDDRKAQMKIVAEHIEVAKLRTLVLNLIDREPGLVFDICEGAGAPPPPGPGPLQPAATTPSWCSCGNCNEMGADLDNKCCGCLPNNCISRRDEMERLVLDPQVLALGLRYYMEMLGRHGQQIEDHNKSMRLSAYHNFTLWWHGRLGAGRRRVVPSCCVLVIRECYPSPTQTYTGFIPGRVE